MENASVVHKKRSKVCESYGHEAVLLWDKAYCILCCVVSGAAMHVMRHLYTT